MTPLSDHEYGELKAHLNDVLATLQHEDDSVAESSISQLTGTWFRVKQSCRGWSYQQEFGILEELIEFCNRSHLDARMREHTVKASLEILEILPRV